jgi:phenylacetate-CoA ligase
MDELMVQVEAAPDLKGQDLSGLKKKLEGEFKKVLGIRAVVQIAPPNTLERTQFKARRVIDKRGLYEEMIGKEWDQ